MREAKMAQKGEKATEMLAMKATGQHHFSLTISRLLNGLRL